MEVITTTDLYLHGTYGYSRVTRSFAAFGGSRAPGCTHPPTHPPPPVPPFLLPRTYLQRTLPESHVKLKVSWRVYASLDLFILRTIHGGISQRCKLIKQPVGLVLHFVVDNLQLVLNSLQQESCEWENLLTQLPCTNVYSRFDFLTWVLQQEPFENVNGGILPGVELTLNSSCPCSHNVKLGFVDTLLLSCVG